MAAPANAPLARDRGARGPSDVSAPGWRAVLVRAFQGMGRDNLSTLAAGMAFYLVWALFPAVCVLVVIARGVLGRGAIVSALSALRIDLPESFNVIVVNQLELIARNRRLSVAVLIAAGTLAVWGGMRGMRSLTAALNVIYAERETRPFWQRQTVALLLAVGSGAFVLTTLVLIIGVAPADAAEPGVGFGVMVAPSRWPILIVTMMLALSILYRYAPSRRAPRWRWVTWGATFSAMLWVAGSWALSWYAAHFAGFNPLLGSLGSVVMFLAWSYLTALTVLLGARINADLERQTDAS
jgi:membrane protein